MSTCAHFLERLAGVKQTAPDRWMSRCPAHEDKSPSLSIRNTDTGKILLYCFAGCQVDDVLAAIGLRMSDLFQKPLADPHRLPQIRGKLTARELLELTGHEITVAWMLIADAMKRKLTSDEWERLSQAEGRVSSTVTMLHVS